MTKAAEKEPVSILPISIQTGTITLIGDSSLICHAWSEKAKRQIREKQAKKAKQARETRNPEEEFRASLYPFEDGYGFPSVGVKSAAVDACSHVSNITKVEARGAFHINGDLVKIQSESPEMREDMVRVGMGAADLRYRGEFKTWRMAFPLRYNASVLSWEQIVNLFNVAGFAIGIGEWRPQKNGSMGMFHVEQS